MFDINEMKKNVSDKFGKVAETNLEAAPKNIKQETTIKKSPTNSQLASIGPSIHFKGELTGEEGLIIDGKVEGTIDLNGNIFSPRVSLEDGAKFKGSIDMSETKHEKTSSNHMQDSQLKRA